MEYHETEDVQTRFDSDCSSKHHALTLINVWHLHRMHFNLTFYDNLAA